jgi:Zn ribbon nucleic-acid-binding protein
VSRWEDKSVIEMLPLGAIKTSGGDVYKANCPSCEETRQRLYFLWNSGKEVTNVYCHNCGYARTLKNFVHDFYPHLIPETHFGRVQDRAKFVEKTLAQRLMDSRKTENIRLVMQREHPPDCILLEHLPAKHKALKYVQERKIPSRHYKNLYYCPNFKELAKRYGYAIDKWQDEDRLIIPFWDKQKRLTYLQGRSFDPETKMRYITLDCKNGALKIWGLDSIDTSKRVYITEGPIDAMFLDNSLAMGGSAVSNRRLLRLLGRTDPKDIVFVYDNEPGNVEIRQQMMDKVRAGFSIILWNRLKVKEKDVNDAVLSGFDVADLEDMIVGGNQATIQLMRWR